MILAREFDAAMVVGENTIVTLQFTIQDRDGEVLDDIYEHTPYRYVFGCAPFFPGLDKGIEGLKPGDAKTFVVPPEEAFGIRDKNLVQRISADELPDGTAEVGLQVRRLSADGESGEPYTITGMLDNWVYLDGNHEWAGEELYYKVRILTVIKGADPRIHPIRG